MGYRSTICTAGLATPIATAVGGGLFGAIVGVAVAGIIVLLAKGSGHRIGHNPFENKQFKHPCKKYKLTKDKEENLHREISQKIYIYKEVEEII